jgi:signal transduction histidine kinase
MEDNRPGSPSVDAAPSGPWLRRLAPATLAVVVVLAALGDPAPALRGAGLAVTVACLVLALSARRLARRTDPDGATVASAAIILASAALVWTQQGGPGVAGLFVAVGYAAMCLPLRRSLALLVLALLTFSLAAAHAHRSLGLTAAGELGIVAFYVIAAFARRLQLEHAETKRLLGELEASRQAREEAAALRERSRIAREIHDVLAHSLSGLMLQLEGARMLAALPGSNGRLGAALDRSHQLAHAGLEEARRAIGALRDEELPGADRLAQLTADFSRDSSIEARLDVLGPPRALDSEASLTIYRVAQEALTNARRHAHPDRVEVRLLYERDGTRLVVEDHVPSPPAQDGTGAGRAGDVGAGYGLTGMRERAELLGGRLHASGTGEGFRVELWLPA